MKIKGKIIVFLFAFISFNCSKQNEIEEGDEINGKWFLIEVNGTDVSNLNCYSDSFIESNGSTIRFFIVNLLEDDTCETVLDSSEEYTVDEGFYYLGDEALDIYIQGNELTWRVDTETELVFKRE